MLMLGFMASRTGRWVRILAGAGLVAGGLSAGSPRGLAVALVGLVPLVAGSVDLCLLAPLFGQPMQGAALRRKLGRFESALLLDGYSRRASSVLLH